FLQRIDLGFDVLYGTTVVGQRASAGIVDVALARVGGKQRAVAPVLFARSGFFLLRLGRGRRLCFALLLFAVRVDTPYDEPLGVELLDHPADALHWNGRAVVALAIRAGAAAGE